MSGVTLANRVIHKRCDGWGLAGTARGPWRASTGRCNARQCGALRDNPHAGIHGGWGNESPCSNTPKRTQRSHVEMDNGTSEATERSEGGSQRRRTPRPTVFTEQLVVRITKGEQMALEDYAAEHQWTVAQAVRVLIRTCELKAKEAGA